VRSSSGRTRLWHLVAGVHAHVEAAVERIVQIGFEQTVDLLELGPNASQSLCRVLILQIGFRKLSRHLEQCAQSGQFALFCLVFLLKNLDPRMHESLIESDLGRNLGSSFHSEHVTVTPAGLFAQTVTLCESDLSVLAEVSKKRTFHEIKMVNLR
jgi:hypothetical protein